jgi:uncharacterized membrane protein YadS
MQQSFIKLLLPAFLVFILVNTLCITLPHLWDSYGINHLVVAVCNFILFALSAITLSMHFKAVKNPNPNVFSASVMGSTVLKLFVLGIATVIYLVIAGKNKSTLAIVAGMILYVIYTVLDVKSALLLNKKQ